MNRLPVESLTAIVALGWDSSTVGACNKVNGGENKYNLQGFVAMLTNYAIRTKRKNEKGNAI